MVDLGMTNWLLVSEVAETLRVSPDHVRRLIRRGDLVAVDVAISGRPSYRVAGSAVAQYLQARQTSSRS